MSEDFTIEDLLTTGAVVEPHNPFFAGAPRIFKLVDLEDFLTKVDILPQRGTIDEIILSCRDELKNLVEIFKETTPELAAELIAELYKNSKAVAFVTTALNHVARSRNIPAPTEKDQIGEFIAGIRPDEIKTWTPGHIRPRDTLRALTV